MTDKQKLRKALRAMRLANDIMDYCGADAWEREATKKDRDQFDKIYVELLGTGDGNG